MLPSLLSNMLNLLLWSGPDAIINTRDPIQNLGQTNIFYKRSQIQVMQTNHDPDYPDDSMQFQL